jgi:aspartyl-tRNA(Asn)/glutamyl-tRNA(Gln) amidotransferase subunit B
VQSRALSEYFEDAVRAGAPPKAVSNWMMGELARALNTRGLDITAAPIGAARLAALLALVDRGTISVSIAKGVFEKMLDSAATADDIVKAEGLAQIDDEAQLRGAIEGVLAANGDAVAQIRAGKSATFGFLVGQVMKATGGKANARRVNELLRGAIDAAADAPTTGGGPKAAGA